MNLHTAGNGLFGTHVTWEDIVEQIQKERKFNAFSGTIKKAELIGDGSGFVSRVALIEADFHGGADDLPSRFVVKMVTTLAGAEISEYVHERQDSDEAGLSDVYDAIVREWHNREVDTYRVFSRFDNSLSKMSRTYFAREFTEENKLKGLEYVDNTLLRHIYHNLDPNELLDVLRAIAYLEAKGLEVSDEERRKLATNPLPILYAPSVNPIVIPKVIHEMYTASEELKPSGEVLEKMANELTTLELTSTINEELGMKDVIVHGDLWPTNMLWKKTESGVELCRILDFQLSHYGCAAVDLCRLLMSTLSGKDRREKWEWLFEKFYGYLEMYCDGQLPYTLEQLKESYRRLFPLAGLLMLELLDPVAKIATRNLPEEEKKKAEAVLLEKTGGSGRIMQKTAADARGEK
ncbi:hypothetical protein RB195_003447 [Necator americanus]|uniref:CHK kinase-like domain-containing protein n=1 Tax=Necator americanus TaxID=51031 RepID=A0ABR1DNL5_NECAM